MKTCRRLSVFIKLISGFYFLPLKCSVQKSESTLQPHCVCVADECSHCSEERFNSFIQLINKSIDHYVMISVGIVWSFQTNQYLNCSKSAKNVITRSYLSITLSEKAERDLTPHSSLLAKYIDIKSVMAWCSIPLIIVYAVFAIRLSLILISR